jgi:hypothetical protein
MAGNGNLLVANNPLDTLPEYPGTGLPARTD